MSSIFVVFLLSEWPDPVKRTFKHLNSVIYTQMQGPSEFGIAGNLANWNVKDLLKNITTPTLTIGAKYDSMDPEHMKWMSTQFPNGTYLYCANGSHMCMYDDQQTYFKGLIKFIKSVDKGEKKVVLN
jgi:proline iminopeptidase